MLWSLTRIVAPGNVRALSGLIILCFSGFYGVAEVCAAAGAESPAADMAASARGGSIAEMTDRRVGEQAAAQIAREMGIVEEGPATDYVAELGQRLMRTLPRRAYSYSFQVVDQATPNAFALPGGFIYVSRGLLALANSEDELANVMGHEITHSELRHSAQRQAMSQWLGLFSLGFAGAGQLAKNGREQENEADRGGQKIAAASGYDPHGMGTFLQRLDAVERLERGWSRLPGFFDTHPGSAERVALTIGRAPHIPVKSGKPLVNDRAAFFRKLEGLGVGQNPAEGLFQESRFIHIDMDFSLRFPDGWTMVNTSRAVGAFSPKHDARVALQLDSKGTDPEQAARNLLAKVEEKLQIEIVKQGTVQLGKVPAFRIEAKARTPEGPVHGIVTWLVHDGFVYRIGYVARAQAFNNYKGRALNVLRSFRRPSAVEKASVKRLELHVVRARAGESLAALGSRVGNAWGAQTTAVMNGLFISDQLKEGQLIKVAIAKAYVPKPEKIPRMSIDE